MSDLRTLPTIIAHAEAEARVRQDGLANRWPSIEDCPPPTWASMAPAERQFLIDVELDLACDLSRPASRDAVARLVAAKVGMFCHDTAPLFERHGADWKMTGTNGQSWWFAAAEHSWLHVYGATGWTVIADLSPDFQEALRLIATYVLRSPDV